MKKSVVAFTIADQKNFGYAKMLENSLRKFHSDKKLPLLIISGDELNNELKKDPQFFYRATPVIAERLMKEYDMVIKIDADSIITGDLSYILNTNDYDVGTVMNWNRIDPQQFGLVQGWGINAAEYMNCGFVAMRNEKFVHHWNVLCFSPQFDRLQYREQDLLNILLYYGNYNARCFDHGDGITNYYGWHGLIAKGEWNRAILKDDKIIIPPSENKGNTPFSREWELKIIHWGGGNNEVKMNYKTRFSDEVSKRIDYLISSNK